VVLPTSDALTLARAAAAVCLLQEATAEELVEIKRRRLHIDCNPSGWNALHYAVATHKVKLVQQLLEIGADPNSAVAGLGLMPLHLGCMGCVEDLPQFNRLVEAAGSLYDLQVRGFFMGAGLQISRCMGIVLGVMSSGRVGLAQHGSIRRVCSKYKYLSA
jgi:hypothetical protein